MPFKLRGLCSGAERCAAAIVTRIDTDQERCYTGDNVARSIVEGEEVGEMRPRWLLLAVSVLCLLVLLPATVLSQQQRAELDATCGAARIDGVMSPGEWDDAGVVAMWVAAGAEAEAMLAELGLEGIAPEVSHARESVAIRSGVVCLSAIVVSFRDSEVWLPLGGGRFSQPATAR